jgi:hypothetical protein
MDIAHQPSQIQDAKIDIAIHRLGFFALAIAISVRT